MGMPRPHRKKTLPVPGDVFISLAEGMRIIEPEGYGLVSHYGHISFRPWDKSGFKPEDFIVNWENVGFYYLGNALTDEWENG